MKLNEVLPLLAIVTILPLGACKSEIDDKTAAGVSEPTATAESAEIAGVPVPVLKDDSSIEFVGRKITRDHDGGFNDFDGSVTFVGEEPKAIGFTIDMNSIWTDTERLTGHLKSADFFEAETYPTATFTSTGITEAPEGNLDNATHMISGTLTMHGVTKGITFPASVTMTPEGIVAATEFTINRQEWGVAYAGKPDDLIKDEVLIKLDLRFPPAPTVATEVDEEPAAKGAA